MSNLDFAEGLGFFGSLRCNGIAQCFEKEEVNHCDDDNMQPYLTMQYCIATAGIFPSRN